MEMAFDPTPIKPTKKWFLRRLGLLKFSKGSTKIDVVDKQAADINGLPSMQIPVQSTFRSLILRYRKISRAGRDESQSPSQDPYCTAPPAEGNAPYRREPSRSSSPV